MIRKKVLAVFVGVAIASALLLTPACQDDSRRPPIKLVVVIVVDQLRFDYFDRFSSVFGRRGFRRLIDNGAFMANADYPYVPTYTAPGHAAIFTGSDPAYDGVVGNDWYDREAGRRRVMVSDDSANLVTSYGVESSTPATRPASPRILIGTTIGDQLRLSDQFKSKVVALSLKDRAAVLPGGKEANGAYWFDSYTGTMVSSDYYFRELPAWARQFDIKETPDRYFGKVWDHSLPEDKYALAQRAVNVTQRSPIGRNFPYMINGGEDKPGPEFYKAFTYSPFASEYLADFARAAVEGEHLGEDDNPDLLAISFSTPDLIGHAYGPDSEEIEDIYVRLDQVMADFLSFLDNKVGLSHTVVVVTGDHGVTPAPALLTLDNIDATTIDPGECKAEVTRALSERFKPGDWVLDLVNDQIYLNRDLMREAKVDPAAAEQVAADALRRVPHIAQVFTRTQILSGEMPSGPIARRVANGFNPERSGDVWLITKPFCFLGEGAIATTHGSPYDYDTHVPLLLAGPGIKPGRYYTECAPTDVSPTLAALLHIEPPPNIIGRVLVEALKQE